MNVLFLTLGNVTDLSANEIYPDLLREFHRNHHNVYVACGREKRQNLPTELCSECGITVLRIRTGNITKTNLIEKGISTLTVEHCFRKAINKYFGKVRFDLILYSTPPITFSSLIRHLKRRDGASTYLMLKDIFPQNAVDLGMFGKKSPIYLYFRQKERELYRISDRIGCMSEGNIRYVTEHNPQIDPQKVALCPNAIELRTRQKTDVRKLREEFGIPQDALILLFGGNLGKPQGIDFLITCLQKEVNRRDVFFVIAGSGTEYKKLEAAISENHLTNTRLIDRLDSGEYNALTAACDVGLIFLDHRFTIPNFPSRILPYMQEGKPILAATDRITDLKQTIGEGDFGWWCPSDDPEAFDRRIGEILTQRANLPQIGSRGRAYLEKHYTVSHCYETICAQLSRRVLIVSQCFYPSVNRGGPAVSVTNLAKALKKYMQVSVLTTAYESGSGERFQGISEGKNRIFDSDVFYLTGKKPAVLKKSMDQIDPDVLYISSLFSAEYTVPALCYAKKHGKRTVLAPRGELQKDAIGRKKLKKYGYLLFLKLAGLTKNVIFHATETVEAERIHCFFPHAEVFSAQNLPRQLDIACRAQPKTAGKLRAVAVCRVHPIKGLDLALRALSNVKEEVSFDIYGPVEDSGYYDHCRLLADGLPKNITVRFCGAILPSELPKIYANTDVLLLPTKTENFGNAIVEALLCGVPAIISNGTPWKSLAEEFAGENASTVEQYVTAIRRFAKMDETEWMQYSGGSEAYIRKRLKTEETVNTYLKMLGGTNETAICPD